MLETILDHRQNVNPMVPVAIKYLTVAPGSHPYSLALRSLLLVLRGLTVEPWIINCLLSCEKKGGDASLKLMILRAQYYPLTKIWNSQITKKWGMAWSRRGQVILTHTFSQEPDGCKMVNRPKGSSFHSWKWCLKIKQTTSLERWLSS